MAESNTSIIVPYVGHLSDADALYPVVQPPIVQPPAGGYAAWLKENGRADDAQAREDYMKEYKPWCTEDGILKREIEVQAPEGSNYSIKASYGEFLDPKRRETSDHTESQTIKGESAYTIPANVEGAIAASWDGPVFGADGSPLSPPPEIVQDGKTLSWGGAVTGSLHLSYTESHDSYTLTIEPRTDDPAPEEREAAYASTLFIAYDDGSLDIQEVELPDVSEDCSDTGGSFRTTTGDKEEQDCVRLVIIVNPCTGEEIERYTESMACPEEE